MQTKSFLQTVWPQSSFITKFNQLCCRLWLLQIILIKASEGISHTQSHSLNLGVCLTLPDFSHVTRLSLAKIKSHHISRGKWTIDIIFNGFLFFFGIWVCIVFFFIERFHIKLHTYRMKKRTRLSRCEAQTKWKHFFCYRQLLFFVIEIFKMYTIRFESEYESLHLI